MRIAIIGSHGLYANYGGWDQLVNNLVEKASANVGYVVFNPKETPVDSSKLPSNVKVISLPLSAAGYQGLIFDYLSIFIAFFYCRNQLLLGIQGLPASAALKFLSFNKLKIAVNIGGVEWERPQFTRFARWYLKACFYLSKRFADKVVIDNKHYLQYFEETFRCSKRLEVVAYGGVIDKSLNKTEVRSEFNFIDRDYYLSISRSIVDNKLQELCDLFSNLPSENLVLISNFSNSVYGRDVFNRYNSYPNIKLIDGLYDKPKLDIVRRSCRAYIHTHTLCGSAPSLIEMIVCRVPIYSIDVAQNRHTLADQGYYFGDFSDLKVMLEGGQLPNIPSLDFAEMYDWHNVVNEYERLFH